MKFDMSKTRHPVPEQALVLVTYGTNPIPLNIIKHLLGLGCRVRAAHPWTECAAWLDNLFAAERAAGRFERVPLPPARPTRRPTRREFFQDAVRGATAVVDTATVVTDHKVPLAEVWAVAKESVYDMLDAAKEARTVKAYVFTSSFRAATELVPERDRRVNEQSWNAEDTIRALTARHGGCFDVVRNSALTGAEEAVWEWQAEQRCVGGTQAFKINVVSPSNVIGQNFGAGYTQRWRNWMWRLHRGGGRPPEVVCGAGPTQRHWYVDIEDVALVHMAAIFDPQVSSARLQVWGHYRDWNDAIEVLNEVDPERKKKRPFIDQDSKKRGMLSTWAPEVRDILRRWKGIDDRSTPCWKPFEKTIAESVEVYRRMEPKRLDAPEDTIQPAEAGPEQRPWIVVPVPMVSEGYFAQNGQASSNLLRTARRPPRLPRL